MKKSNRDRHVVKIDRDVPHAPLMSIQDAEEGELHNSMVSNVNESEVVSDGSIDKQQVDFYISADEEPVINNDGTMVDVLAELNTIYDQRTTCL